MSAQRIENFVSPEEYLALDRAADYKSEYFSGEMVAMSGASDPHELLVYNICGELRTSLHGKNCTGRPSNLRVRVNPTNYLYPDVTVTCGERLFADGEFVDTLLNPMIVFEVLSPSTEHKDRGIKWHLYKQISSLRHYVLVAQDRAFVEVFTRQDNGDWLIHTEDSLDGNVSLPAVDVALPMSGIYEDITFPVRPVIG